MKVKINRESFQKVFQVAAAVAPARSPKTILQNVKMDVTEKGGLLTATDMEVGVRLNIPDLDVDTVGSAVIPVQRLNMILRESSDEFLFIESDPDKTLVTGQSSRFELQSQNPDEFPEVADFEDSDYFEVTAGVMRELIKRTLFATDSESSRYALGGVLLEMEGDSIVAVGTDGRRLAKMQGALSKIGNPTAGSATIVPARAMQLIERILPEDSVKIQLAARANDLLIREPGCVFYTRLVEGRFPKWRDVLPDRKDSNRIDIPVGPMYSALRQAAIVSSDESRGVDFTFNQGSLVLSNSTAEVGQSRIEMPVPFDNEELTITLDHRYVADFLKVLQPDKTFTLDIENGDQAAYCVTDDNYGYVIMPLAKDRR
ncbi:DNA polymerase III subunit beta [Mariniblastus sp.]|nr:DNA polymerase III subunit beta [Mariniblastus sp.]